MTRHRHPTLERIVRRLTPSAESFAAAAAIYSPELMLQLEATWRDVGGSRRYEVGSHTSREVLGCPAR